MSSCTYLIKQLLPPESRGRHFIKILYFTLPVWNILYYINAELNQKCFLAEKNKYVYTYPSIQKGNSTMTI